MSRPQRRTPRLKHFDYATEGAYFVTVCVAGMRCILGDVIDGEARRSSLGSLVASEWRLVPERWPGRDKSRPYTAWLGRSRPA